MYSQHFGLKQDPFSIAPDPSYLFMSERHREALAHLLFGVSGPNSTAGGAGGGFVLLTGDIGTGKTTICRCFLEQIPKGCHVAYIFNPKLTVVELLHAICEEFHITLTTTGSTPATLKNYIDALNAFLLQSHAAGQSCVLIIDEAQNLAADVLEQLRLLTNLETNARKLLQIVLIGQPELRTMLARPELEQLAQRVIARFHLGALTEAESAQYIQHRLAVAGHRGALPFDRKALQAIHRLTRGVPRRINLLCGRALLGAWATGQQSVNPSIVKKAAGEVFGQLPTAAKQTSGITRTVWLLAILGILLGLLAATHLNLSAGLTTPKQAPQLATTQDVSKSQAQAAVTPASTTATASTTITSTTVTSTTTTSSTALPLEAVLPQLASDINLAWNALAPLWQLPANSADLCATASAEQLQCYRTTKLNLPLLRQLARPGIVVLQANENTRSPASATARVYAVLLDLGENTAILQIGDQRQTVSLSTLLLRWRGEFATLWRAPEGYSRAAEVGAKSPAISLLRQQLQQLDGLPASSPSANPANAQLLDAALKQRLRDFQRTHGLTADGLPGPMTYMQLESALRINTPRLPGTVL